MTARRTVICCAGAALLAGCSRYDSNNGGLAAGPPAQGTPAQGAPVQGAATPAASGSPHSTVTPLATVADIPIGGGTVLVDRKIVITQPRTGTFAAFSAVCTHAGCTVGGVSGGTINCPCHGSRFSVNDGSVVNGPAGSPLPPVAIEVRGTTIVAA